MSLFESFTGPKWQHSNPQVRKHAVAELDDPEVLLELAKTDPDMSVRAAALSHIGNPDALDELIETLPPTLQQQARAQRLGQLLPATDQLAGIHDDATLLRIAALTDQPELITAALGRIKSTELRMDLACHHPVASVRMGAALGIQDLDLLGELMQRVRGHDKGVYRHCKTMVDEHHARQLAETQRQEKIARAIEQAKELAEASDSSEYAARYRGLELQWKMLANGASPEQQQSFSSELASCGQKVEQQAMARAQHAAAGEEAKAQRAAAGQVIAGLLAVSRSWMPTPRFPRAATLSGNWVPCSMSWKQDSRPPNRSTLRRPNNRRPCVGIWSAGAASWTTRAPCLTGSRR